MLDFWLTVTFFPFFRFPFFRVVCVGGCWQLAHPIVESLRSTDKEWLIDLLYAFNSGVYMRVSACLSVIACVCLCLCTCLPSLLFCHVDQLTPFVALETQVTLPSLRAFHQSGVPITT